MYDPMTQIWSCAIPLPFEYPDRLHLFTIWHLDPEAGFDNSCQRAWFIKIGFYTGEVADYVRRRLELCGGRWWNREIRWRAHVWHWRVEFDLARNLWRWITRRCYVCRKRFGYFEGACRDANGVHHFGCRGEIKFK